MGPSVSGFVKELVGKPRTLDDGRPGGFYIPRFRNLKDRQPDFIRGYGFEGEQRHRRCFRDSDASPGFRQASTRRRCASWPAPRSAWAASARCSRATRTPWSLDPEVVDKWGIPVLRFSFKFGDNEKKMCADMAATARRRCSRRPASRSSTSRRRDEDRGLVDPRAGHRAHGHRSEDVGPQPVPAVARRQQPVRGRRQQPRERVLPESRPGRSWRLCWRSCDYLADQLRKGEL